MFRFNSLPTTSHIHRNAALVRVSIFAFIIVILACCTASIASLDAVDWIVPGDASDIVAAGLMLPGQFALYPDTARPISLLNYPTSLTTKMGLSCPLHAYGDDPKLIRASAAACTLNWKGSVRGVTSAAAGSIADTSLKISEDGQQYTSADGSQDTFSFGVAANLSKTQIGLSTIKSRSDLCVSSTHLSGIETVSDSDLGYISSNPLQTTTTAEISETFGTYSVGLLASSGSGNLDLRTISDEQSYSALGDISAWRLAPYVIHKCKSAVDMLLFDMHSQDVDGPVLVGRILAGAWTGKWRSDSAAFAHLSQGARGRRLYSIEYAGQRVDLSGTAGGFLLPGLFSSVYSTDNYFSLRQITARYGSERIRGNYRLRWSVMLARCVPNGSTYSTKAEWLQPSRVISNDHIEDTTAWVLSPGFGLGYSKSDYSVDAGLSLYGALICRKRQEKAHQSEPPVESSNEHSRTLPGYRLGITIRRQF